MAGLSAAAALVLALQVYLPALRAPGAGLFHDDAVYLVTARSLAEGHGYRIESLPDEPVQTKYPFLFPAALAAVWRWAPSFPDNVPWLRVVPVSAMGVWLFLGHALLRRLGATAMAATVMALAMASSPWVVFLATSFLAEGMFGALVIGGCLALEASRTQPGRGRDLVAGAALGLATATKAMGAPCLLAALAWYAWRRSWGGAARFGAAAFVALAPWLLHVALAAAAPADPYYGGGVYASWHVFRSDYQTADRVAVVAINALLVALGPLALHVTTLPPAAVVAAPVIGLILLRGGWRLRASPTVWVTGAAFAVFIVWLWPPMRLLVPFTPVIYWLLAAGAPAALRPVGPVAALLATGLALPGALDSGAAAARHGVFWPAASSADHWDEVVPLLQWVRRHTEPDAVVAANLDPLVYLMTGRHAVRAFSADPGALHYGRQGEALGAPSELRQRLLRSRVEVFVETKSPGFAESPHLRRQVEAVQRACPGALLLAAGDPTTGYAVYTVDRRALERRSCAGP